MTREDAIQHWQQGARDALEAAQLLADNGKYELALFHCHLAAEKALKAKLIITSGENELPHIHDLLELAKELELELTNEQQRLCNELNLFAIEGRYADPVHTQKIATDEYAQKYIRATNELLSDIL